MLQHPNVADACAALLSLVKDPDASHCGKANAIAGLEHTLPKSEDWLYLAIENLAGEPLALDAQLSDMEGCIITHCTLRRRLE
jgi:hypothetical protein